MTKYVKAINTGHGFISPQDTVDVTFNILYMIADYSILSLRSEDEDKMNLWISRVNGEQVTAEYVDENKPAPVTANDIAFADLTLSVQGILNRMNALEARIAVLEQTL